MTHKSYTDEMNQQRKSTMVRIPIHTAVAALIAVAACGFARAQTTPGQGSVTPQMMPHDADPNWDVVSVKPSDPNDTRDFFDVRGRHLIMENETIETMMMMAYGVQKNQIVGGPDWMRSQHFDVDGVPDIVGQPGVLQYQSLFRKLLQARFGLALHHEQRVMPMFALTVAKQGPKLTPSKGDPNGFPNEDGGGGNIRESAFTNTSMQDLVIMFVLDRYVDRPIVDRTGIKGRYDFKLRWTVDEAKTTTSDGPPGRFTAIQEQLGLKLEPQKGPADVLVIDHIDRPSPN